MLNAIKCYEKKKNILIASCHFGFLFKDQSSLNPQFCDENTDMAKEQHSLFVCS